MAKPVTVRPPVQARSRRTLQRILDATRALLAERGREGVTVQDVVARARTSVGSFYARFSSREDLLGHLDEELTRSAIERWDAELAARVGPDAPLATRVRAVVELLVVGDGDRVETVDNHRREVAARALLERRREIRNRHAETAVELGYAAVVGAVRERPAGWDDARLSEELTRLWLCYLDRGEGESPAKGGVDFFQVWG